MKLGIAERIRLLGILPEKGNIVTLKIVGDLRSELSFSEEEIRDFGLNVTNDRIIWNDGAEEKEVTFGDQATLLVARALKELNEKEELTLADVGLFEKFVEGE